MAMLKLEQASNIVDAALETGRQMNTRPLTVVILDHAA